MTQEVLKLALDALEACNRNDMEEVNEAITAIKKALAQPPVALPCCGYTDASAVKWNPLNGVVQCHNCGQTYTTPQRTEQEPMAWYCCFQGQEEGEFFLFGSPNSERYPSQYKTPLYEHLPQRTWVGLAAEEKSEMWEISRAALPRYATYATLIETNLKEKNT